jgi:cytochrome c oxidase cbb3-type subunit III
MARHFSLINSSLMLISCMTLLGCGQLPGKPKPGPEVPRPESVVDFATLYSQNCSGCHGPQGMNGSSYPLANPTYQSLVDEQVLHQAVANGLPGTLMPAFAISAGGTLTDQQVDALVKGMRAAWYKAATLDGANAPPYKAAKAADSAHGLQVYITYCSSCHGEVTRSPKADSTDTGHTQLNQYHITIKDGGKAGSIINPAFLSLVSDQVLRTIVIAGRPDVGQPDWRNDVPGHPMSDQEVTDVVAWLSSARPQKPGGGSQ